MKIIQLDGECGFFSEASRMGFNVHLPKSKPFTGSIRGVLVLQQGRLGDLCMTLPLLSTIQALFANAKITLVVREDMKQIAESFPYVDELIGMRVSKDFTDIEAMSSPVKRISSALSFKSLSGYQAVLNDLKGHTFDMGLDVFSRRRNRILLRSAGALARAGFWLSGDKWTSHPSPWRDDNVALQNVSLLESMIGEKIEYTHHRHDLRRDKVAGCDIVIHLSDGNESSRRWHVSHWVRLVEDLSKKYSVRVLYSDNESETAMAIRSLVPIAQYVKVTKFRALAGHLSSTKLVIGVDGGPLHVADMLNVPVLGLFSREDARVWGFLTEGSVAIKGINGVCARRNCGWSACIDSVSPIIVAKHAHEMLGRLS